MDADNSSKGESEALLYDYNKLKKDLEFYTQLANDLEDENHNLLCKINQLENSMKNKEETNAELVNESSISETSLDCQQCSGNCKTSNELEQLKVSFKLQESKYEDAIDLIKYYEDNLHNSISHENRDEKIPELENQINELKEEIQQNQNRLSEFYIEYENAQELIASLRSTLNEYKENLQRKEEELVFKNDELNDFQNQLVETRSGNKGNSMFSELDDRRRKAEILVNSLKQENEILRSKVGVIGSKFTNDLHKLKCSIDDLAKERNAAADYECRRAFEAEQEVSNLKIQLEKTYEKLNMTAKSCKETTQCEFSLNEYLIKKMKDEQKNADEKLFKMRSALSDLAYLNNKLSVEIRDVKCQFIQSLTASQKNNMDKENLPISLEKEESSDKKTNVVNKKPYRTFGDGPIIDDKSWQSYVSDLIGNLKMKKN